MKIKEINFGPVITTVPEERFVSLGLQNNTLKRRRKQLVMRGGGVVLAVDTAGIAPLETFLSSGGLLLPNEPFLLSIDPSSFAFAAERISQSLKEKAFRLPFGVLIDFSNTPFPSSREDVIRNTAEAVAAFAPLGIPVFLGLSVITAPDLVADIVDTCKPDGLFASPWVSWNSLTAEAKKVFFRRKESPFRESAKVSGKYVVPLVAEWARQIRRQGVLIPVIAGGVISKKEVSLLSEAGIRAIVADSLVLTLRPWNVFLVRRAAKKLFT